MLAHHIVALAHCEIEGCAIGTRVQGEPSGEFARPRLGIESGPVAVEVAPGELGEAPAFERLGRGPLEGGESMVAEAEPVIGAEEGEAVREHVGGRPQQGMGGLGGVAGASEGLGEAAEILFGALEGGDVGATEHDRSVAKPPLLYPETEIAAPDLARDTRGFAVPLQALGEPAGESRLVEMGETEAVAERRKPLQLLETAASEGFWFLAVERGKGAIAEDESVLGIEQGKAVEQHFGGRLQQGAAGLGLTDRLLEAAFVLDPFGDVLQDAEIACHLAPFVEPAQAPGFDMADAAIGSYHPRPMVEVALGRDRLGPSPPARLAVLGMEDGEPGFGIEAEGIGFEPGDPPDLLRPPEAARGEVVVPKTDAGDAAGELELTDPAREDGRRRFRRLGWRREVGPGQGATRRLAVPATSGR